MPTGSKHEFVEDPRNQEDLICVNGELFPCNEARISVFGRAFLVGGGIWESFRLTNGRLAFVRQHLARPKANLKAMDYDLDRPVADLIEAVYQTVQANRMTSNDVHIRLMLSRGSKRSPSQDPKLHTNSKQNCILACIQATKAGADEALILDPRCWTPRSLPG